MTTPDKVLGEQSPEEQQEQRARDLEGVKNGVDGADWNRNYSEMRALLTPPGTRPAPVPTPLLVPQGIPGFATRTSFEGHDLNAMIDLVEQASPTDLENAGAALWKARNALRAAAKELQDYVDKVDWKGQGATEFQKFGRGLATHARSLSDFADVAGTQITVAGTGLASVHKSMPPRDGRFVKSKVEDLPMVSQVEGNASYDGAVKVEKDRQEAINQMNRLSSFYAVSQQTLALQEPPRFEQILKANVPPPSGGGGPSEAPTRSNPREMGVSRATAPPATARPDAVRGSTERQVDPLGTPAPTAPGGTIGAPVGVSPSPGDDASMELARTAVPPAPTPTPVTGAPPQAPVTAPPGQVLGTPPPMAPGYVPPVRSGPPGMPGNQIGRTGQPPLGRAGTTGQPPLGRAGTTGQPPMGRAGTTGQPPMGRAGTTGQPPLGRAGTTGQPPMGRAGTTGQPPLGRAGTTGQTPTGRAGTTGQPPTGRVGRADGITGGKPQRTPAGTSGSRIPRGTVIGSESTSQPRTAGTRVPTNGAIGAQPAAGTTSRGRTTPATNGVVGMPRSDAASQRSRPGRPDNGGFTQGGAGLVRSPSGSRKSEESGDQEGAKRPDHLTEDEETWTAGRRDSAPPVIG
ncbi:hypothetical protein ACFYVL_16920 [Streptomyces sp. NPDC004111]|uniref:hypothetical protein n=1 Tax=Streptomyces sp. NPDC004111 TaxID=3364690 RepID=UPI003681642F